MAEENAVAPAKNEEIQIAVFDLNETFYNKSSKEEFYKFVCAREPKRISYIFEMGYFVLLKELKQMRQTEFKENFFNYLDKLPPEKVAAYAREFWQQEFPQHFNKKILERLEKLKQQGVKIFCGTGGLELYVKPLFDLYSIDGLVGTRVNYTGKTYVVEGEACKGEEKIRRLSKLLDGKNFTIVEGFSDRKEEIIEKAKKGYLVKDGNLSPLS